MPTFGRTSDSIAVNPTVDRYTATASQTVFTLSATPSAQMLVWVNGVLQEPTTHYTLSGRTLTLGTASTVGDKVAVEYGTGGSAPVRTVATEFTGGNVNTSISTSWVAVNSSTWDVSIAAVAGDMIEVNPAGIFASGADILYVDMFTVISGTMTRSWGNGAALSNAANGVFPVFTSSWGPGGTKRRVCVAGDIVNGAITFRLAWRNNGGSASPQVFASANAPLQLALVNYGQ